MIKLLTYLLFFSSFLWADSPEDCEYPQSTNLTEFIKENSLPNCLNQRRIQTLKKGKTAPLVIPPFLTELTSRAV